MPQNSSPYRKAPLKRTRDSFIDDNNSVQNPRIDYGRGRGTQIRRDQDKMRNIGVTLYDIDFAVKSFVEQTMQLKVEDNGETVPVTTIYANAEKWASIQRNGHLKDKKGKTLVPLITFRRSNVAMKNEMRRNKVANTNQLSYIMQPKYNRKSPYDKWSTLYGNADKRPFEYFVTPIPDYVDVSYDFIVWCEYQNQLNYLIEQFVYFAGQSFGERNFFKFSTNTDSFALEDSNTTGQDRLVRASFQLIVHGYLLPKTVAAQNTTKRVVSANKIQFVSEAFRSIDGVMSDLAGQGNGFKNLNDVDNTNVDELSRRLNDFTEISIRNSPDVYPTEND
jgi:hypothetical protein